MTVAAILTFNPSTALMTIFISHAMVSGLPREVWACALSRYYARSRTNKLLYHNIPGKRPCPCTTFQGATVAASIQTCGIFIPGKRPCGPKSRIMFKRPWALTQDTMVYTASGFSPQINFNAPERAHFSINGSLAGNWASYEAIPREYLGFIFNSSVSNGIKTWIICQSDQFHHSGLSIMLS